MPEQVLKNSEFLSKCLAGRWGVSANLVSDLGVLKSWTRIYWRLDGNLQLSLIGGSLILFEFENPFEAKRV